MCTTIRRLLKMTVPEGMMKRIFLQMLVTISMWMGSQGNMPSVTVGCSKYLNCTGSITNVSLDHCCEIGGSYLALDSDTCIQCSSEPLTTEHGIKDSTNSSKNFVALPQFDDVVGPIGIKKRTTYLGIECVPLFAALFAIFILGIVAVVTLALMTFRQYNVNKIWLKRVLELAVDVVEEGGQDFEVPGFFNLLDDFDFPDDFDDEVNIHPSGDSFYDKPQKHHRHSSHGSKKKSHKKDGRHRRDSSEESIDSDRYSHKGRRSTSHSVKSSGHHKKARSSKAEKPSRKASGWSVGSSAWGDDTKSLGAVSRASKKKSSRKASGWSVGSSAWGDDTKSLGAVSRASRKNKHH